MKITIRRQQKVADDDFTDKVRRRLRFVLSRFASSIHSISVSFDDLNGPKGGIDMRCVVNVKLSTSGEVVIQGEAEQPLAALNYCLARAERTINRKLEKRRDMPIRVKRRNTEQGDEFYLSGNEVQGKYND
jgi:ribosome-associated translation inhibitor RaiA